MNISEGDIYLHKVYVDETSIPYYLGWVIVKRSTPSFVDFIPICDESFCKYGHMYTRPILAIPLRYKNISIRMKIKSNNTHDIIQKKKQIFEFMPREKYELYTMVKT